MDEVAMRAFEKAGKLIRGRGFTLLELMVVLLILALLASIAAPQVTKHLRKAKVETAHIQVDALSAAVDTFYLDVGRFPSDEEGLAALVDQPADVPGWDGPYIRKRESLIDPWGEPYQYRLDGSQDTYEIFVLDRDGQGEDDEHALGASER